MDVLWAPWRMDYILSGDKMPECIFCTDENRAADRERLILFRGRYTLIIMNRYPYVNGHLLVAPIRHVSGLNLLSDEEKLDLLTVVSESMEILKRVMNAEGFNAGLNLGRVAGAGIEDHMHFHIVPRWHGDTNFMTVLGDVRIIPEHIRSTYEKLLPAFRGIGNV